MARILILGAGFGGLACATELARLLPPGHEVVLVDAKDRFLMGLSKWWILDGRRSVDAPSRAIRDIESHGVRFVRGEVQAVALASKTVTVSGQVVAYDYLVVALGTAITLGGIPGLREAAHNLYDLAGVAAFHAGLANLGQGRVLIAVCGPPFRCPPAPYEAAMLVGAFLRARGGTGQVTLATPEPHPLPVAGPVVGGQVAALLAKRSIRLLTLHAMQEVDVARRVVRFKDGSEEPYDLLGAIPFHHAAPILKAAGLTGPAGWIEVDRHTLATQHPDVWAVGDCTVIPLSIGKPLVKAGTLAEQEGEVVARNIAHVLAGEAPQAQFDGKGVCFVEVGDGLAAVAQGAFFAEPAPVFTLRPPSAAGMVEKEAFEAERLRRWFG